MTITTAKNIDLPIDKDSHILTYAEEGFSPLNIYSESYGLNLKVIKEFADAVNQRNESGSLLPKAPISAIPRHLIREYGPEVEPALRNALKDFLEANQKHIRAKKVIIDFRTPKVSDILFQAITDVFGTHADPELEEVLVIDGD